LRVGVARWCCALVLRVGVNLQNNLFFYCKIKECVRIVFNAAISQHK